MVKSKRVAWLLVLLAVIMLAACTRNEPVPAVEPQPVAVTEAAAPTEAPVVEQEPAIVEAPAAGVDALAHKADTQEVV